MKYNKSEIMKTAWAYFNNEDKELCDFEYLEYLDRKNATEKTFALCLKEAWGKEKEYVERREAEKAYAQTSDEKKAWDWACKKLDVNFELTDEEKVRFVSDEWNHCWPGTSVWSAAMRAVKLHIKIAA